MEPFAVPATDAPEKLDCIVRVLQPKLTHWCDGCPFHDCVIEIKFALLS
jgi:hypothetical protein